MTQNDTFNTWRRLIALLNMQGDESRDFCHALNIELTEFLKWHNEGVPEHLINDICHHYSVPRFIFSQPIKSEFELEHLLISALSPDNKTEIEQRLAFNKSSKNQSLDLSGLLLSSIPAQVYEHTWLTELNLKGNKLTTLPTQLLSLEHLESLDISENFIEYLPAPVINLTNLKEVKYHGNQLKKVDINLDYSGLLACAARQPSTVLISNHLNLTASIIDNIRNVIEPTHHCYIRPTDDPQLLQHIKQAEFVIYLTNTHDAKAISTVISHWLNEISTPTFVIAGGRLDTRAIIDIEKQIFTDIKCKHTPISIIDLETDFQQVFNSYCDKLHKQNALEAPLIKKLELENIGVYEKLSVDFDQKLSVLVGLNGAGKSTILKAIALAILGIEKSQFGQHQLHQLLRITGKSGEQTNHQAAGKITLYVEQNNKHYSNTINLHFQTNIEQVVIEGQPFELFFDSNDNLKTLVLGIPELRSIESNQSNNTTSNTKAKPLDLLPLLTKQPLNSLSQFDKWVADNAIESLNGKLGVQQQISLCFDIFSNMMDEEINFIGIQGSAPVTVWIEHQTPKQQVPLALASQGYKSVMGWIGNILQRMHQAYSDCLIPSYCPAIVLIDEIDQFLHIKWQQRILNVLALTFFPNTQWIITTHSPIVVNNLEQHQVIQLHSEQNNLIAESNQVDLWLWQYDDIIAQLFDVIPESKLDISKLEQRVLVLENISARDKKQQAQLKQLKERLERAKESRMQIDELYKQTQQLKEQQSKIEALLTKLKQASDNG